MFLAQAPKHAKPIGVLGEAEGLLTATLSESISTSQLEGMGITIGRDGDQQAIDQFVSSVGKQYWKRCPGNGRCLSRTNYSEVATPGEPFRFGLDR